MCPSAFALECSHNYIDDDDDDDDDDDNDGGCDDGDDDCTDVFVKCFKRCYIQLRCNIC